MTYAAIILAVLKAIPILERMFERVVDLYLQQVKASDEGQVSRVNLEREKLLEEINKPEITQDEKAAIRRRLFELQRK